METGLSTVTTPFTSEVGEISYEYTATRLESKIPHVITFTVKRDSVVLIKGSSRPAEGGFYFETLSSVSAVERLSINNQINTDLVEIENRTKEINLITE